MADTSPLYHCIRNLQAQMTDLARSQVALTWAGCALKFMKFIDLPVMIIMIVSALDLQHKAFINNNAESHFHD